MSKRFSIFDNNKEQKLLDKLFGSFHERNEAYAILRKDGLNYCRSRGKKLGFNSYETSELFGDAMLAFFESLQKNGIKKNPAGYLKVIVKHKSIDRLNKKKEITFLNLEQIEISTVEDDEQKEVVELREVGINKVLHVMEQISPNYKSLIHCFYFLKMSLHEIALEQNTSPEVIKTQLSRARKAIKDLLK